MLLEPSPPEHEYIGILSFFYMCTYIYIFKILALETYVGAAACDTEYKLLCKVIAKCLHKHINKTNLFSLFTFFAFSFPFYLCFKQQLL